MSSAKDLETEFGAFNQQMRRYDTADVVTKVLAHVQAIYGEVFLTLLAAFSRKFWSCANFFQISPS